MAVRQFADVLRELRGGVVLDELAEQLQALVNAVEETGKAGAISLTLAVKPMSNTDSGAMVVTDKITLKAPKIESKGTVMFATPEGNLQRKNARQDDLPGISLANEKVAA